MQLSVVIINYNVKHFLEQCLCSVLKACRNLEAEILVIDNHSTDGSQAYFKDRFREVRFVWKTSNNGFARACNEGWKMASGEYILFLNPDTLLPENGLELSLAFMQQHPDAGAMGVKMIDGSGCYLPESKRGFPGAWASFCKMAGLTRLFPQSRFFARYYLGHLSHTASHPADVLSGACMLVRRSILEQTGGFDESFFMYAEDIDLSYRIQQAGFRNYYFAGTTILHFKGESTVKQSPSYIRHFYGTMIQFVEKHYRGISRHLYILLLRGMIAAKLQLVSQRTTEQAVHQKEKCYVLGLPESEPLLHALLARYFSAAVPVSDLSAVPAGSVVLLCEPGCSFDDILRLMEKHPARYRYCLHSSCAAAIIGSAERGEQGLAMV